MNKRLFLSLLFIPTFLFSCKDAEVVEPQASSEPKYVDGKVEVVFDLLVSQEAAKNLLNSFGLTAVSFGRDMSAIGWIEVDTSNLVKALNALNKDRRVAWAYTDDFPSAPKKDTAISIFVMFGLRMTRDSAIAALGSIQDVTILFVNGLPNAAEVDVPVGSENYWVTRLSGNMFVRTAYRLQSY